jgi:glycosyltransferase A (GT-A) superfamily protein (DUF2064 family)
VFVPALDGGYSIVGLRRRTPGIFADIPWSTPSVMRRSLEQAERHAIPVKVLSPWYDIDDSDSLDWLLAELRGERPPGLADEGASAPATREVLGLEA